MSDGNDQKLQQLQRAYEMQKKARSEAEKLLEDKSRELYAFNESLKAALEKADKHQAQLLAQEKIASVGQLGACLAHELNNPIAFIQNNLRAIEDYITKLATGLEASLLMLNSLSEQNKHSVNFSISDQVQKIHDDSEIEFIRDDLPNLFEESYEGIRRVSVIANSLRYFANPNRSTQTPFDVNECITQAQTLVQHKDQLIDLRLELQDLPPLVGLPMLLSQAIANLIQNAVEATNSSENVVIRSFKQENNIVIEITDSGHGLDKAALKKISMPFYTTKEDHNGLGLNIAKQIIDQHEGTLQIRSEPGKGTHACINLPFETNNADGEQ